MASDVEFMRYIFITIPYMYTHDLNDIYMTDEIALKKVALFSHVGYLFTTVVSCEVGFVASAL